MFPLRDENPTLRTPIATLAIIAANLSVWIWLQGLGAELKDFYLVAGQYDAVVIVEAPDDATAAKASIALASQGNIRIETLRAFTEAEYRDLLAGIS